MTKVKVAVYRDRKLIGLLGVSLTRTTKDFLETDLTEAEIQAFILKYRFERGRK